MKTKTVEPSNSRTLNLEQPVALRPDSRLNRSTVQGSKFPTRIGLPLLAALFTVPFAALAQSTNGVPDITAAPLPAKPSDFWAYGIAVVVPILVGLFKKAVPHLPKWVLPVSTPFVGLLLGALLKWAGAQGFGWWDSALAGAAGVMLREGWNQVVTAPLKGEEAAKTKGPEDLANRHP